MPNEVNENNEITNWAPAKVRAKFFVQTISKSSHAKGAVQVTLTAVSRGEENKEWASYTPSGQITMSIKAGAAADFFDEHFESGTELYIDFTPVTKTE